MTFLPERQQFIQNVNACLTSVNSVSEIILAALKFSSKFHFLDRSQVHLNFFF